MMGLLYLLYRLHYAVRCNSRATIPQLPDGLSRCGRVDARYSQFSEHIEEDSYMNDATCGFSR
jgi:hypothetical protein